MNENTKEFKLNHASPYLSVVAASRNDDHGGDPLIRTQIFINNFARQCDRYNLPAELIIVDWNPVPDRPGLAAVLELPLETTCLKAKVITVPEALHQRLKYSEKLPLFQMIAKNVGIRRAVGEFILATNIDILFSNELIEFIAKKKLDNKKQYRVDRYDIQKGLSQHASLEDAISYAWSNPIRTNRRYQPEKLVQNLYGNDLFRKSCIPDPEFRKTMEGVDVVYEDDVWQLRPERSVNMSHLHTNACGDFTLLSREGWEAIRGYPEFAAYSFNIDSMGVIAAHYAGYEEVSLLPPCVCFHIEHGIGSGWTPEGEEKLFKRLRDAGVLNPDWRVLTPLVNEMRGQSKSLEFNHENWGLADFELPDQLMGDVNVIPAEILKCLSLQAKTREVSAIQPGYDLDRLTLMQERGLMQEFGLGDLKTPNEYDRAVIYIPNSDGSYSELNTMVSCKSLETTTSLVFRIERFSSEFPLRFDPSERPGLVSISSIVIYDLQKSKVILDSNNIDKGKFIVAGTAVCANSQPRWPRILLDVLKLNSNKSINLISMGADPQLIFPRLPIDVDFPLVIAIDIKFTPMLQ